MLLNDAPLARISKSISSSSAHQIVELFGAPVRTISTPLPIFARSDKKQDRDQANYGDWHPENNRLQVGQSYRRTPHRQC
ncbi:hypothetical protein [Bradyrhizobium sp. 17]|uniref:hypothetical protein n=1 Tax=Bradyrhizobium sp. 17 TaxID=2782649 RepID=UPI001FF9E10D|nr:hypothetical protein [Bradyrhizobium sp. 17]MCK1520324.1 hypothetical protein [Bradyrhizobium sp. 17]